MTVLLSVAWAAVYQQMRRWMFEQMVHDLLLSANLRGPISRSHRGHLRRPGHAVDTGERGSGRVRRLQAEKGSKVHIAVDTLGNLLAQKSHGGE